ncbi:hypothetical protein MG293_018693 [Ovis ammon polii]|uniref:Uncharacterized protein n=1 Tax=Ovis ammon polii TaxID=230172 RepID=A0AAD4TR31_OVIAM|nr:hypothetical protein MG293_018693 [Ovis ammon polii]
MEEVHRKPTPADRKTLHSKKSSSVKLPSSTKSTTREAKNLFGDRTSSEESLLHSIRSGNLLGARNYPARGWVDDPRTPLAANSGSLISSEMRQELPPKSCKKLAETILVGGKFSSGTQDIYFSVQCVLCFNTHGHFREEQSPILEDLSHSNLPS